MNERNGGCDAEMTAALSPEAAAAWDATVTGFLAHCRSTPDQLGRVFEAAPDFALARIAKGFFLLLLGRSELAGPARQELEEARAISARVAQPMPERLAAFEEALAHYAAGRPGRAASRLALWLEMRPDDILALKLDHAIRFVLGDRRGMLERTSAAIPRCVGAALEGFALGCHAFALEENGDYSAAERAGRAAIELETNDAWALHAVAHVYDMTARNDQGIAWLAGQAGRFEHCNNFGAHVWWHLALFHLDRGEYDAVLNLYDARIRAEHTDDYRDISNGAAMLTRLEIEGIEVGDRWDELAALSENRVEPGCVVFADLHYLLALEAGGRRGAADKMICRLAADAQGSDHDMHEVAAVAGLPAARGLAAFRAGHYGTAFDALRSCRADLQRVGGSHAQRDVFSRLLIEAGIRAGRWAEAEAELAGRAKRRGAEDGFTARRRHAIARARAAAEGIAAE
ncbi:MAG: tetratricopeptide repeat protein [Pseudomonadota bacterium]